MVQPPAKAASTVMAATAMTCLGVLLLRIILVAISRLPMPGSHFNSGANGRMTGLS
jgi:hypothetical protein